LRDSEIGNLNKIQSPCPERCITQTTVDGKGVINRSSEKSQSPGKRVTESQTGPFKGVRAAWEFKQTNYFFGGD